MDAGEQELLSLQQQFLESKNAPAATLKRPSRFKTQRQQDSSKSIQEPSPGYRVNLDLDSEEEGITHQSVSSISGIIRDIVERDVTSLPITGSTMPSTMPSQTSLPRPKKIDWRTKNRNTQVQLDLTSQDRIPDRSECTEVSDVMAQIDRENNQRLESMTENEILLERTELNSNLNPGLIAALKSRRKRKSQTEAYDMPEFGPTFVSEAIASIPTVQGTSDRKADQEDILPRHEEPSASQIVHEVDQVYTSAEEAMQDDPSSHVHSDACTSLHTDTLEAHTIHFPTHPDAQELDPNSTTFFADLKSKYFPNLAYDPSKLAWMQPPTETEDISEYHESHASLMPAQLRFDFQGNFVPPRVSRELDNDTGLHHHSDAPLAAGYNIPELVHLCRSAYPSQACIAIQTIGRVMYKIGKHFYGESISEKLKSLIDKSSIECTLLERAGDRHLGVSSYATEALWQANLGREGRILQGQ